MNLPNDAIKFADFSESFRRAAFTAGELGNAFSELAEAAKKVHFPPWGEVARIRMRLMYETYGMARFMMPSWWQWLWIALRPNAQGEPQP